MGSKNLKAVAISGTKEVPLADREGLKLAIAKALPKLNFDPAHRLKKEQFLYGNFVDFGINSVHNWRDGVLEGFKEAVLEETKKHVYDAKPYHCSGCRTSCIESHVGEEGRLLHWESFAPLGSQCGITDMSVVQRAFAICNKHGVDCISVGGVMSFAMECFEEGLIGGQDADGIELRFGNGEAMLAMLEKVCQREGFGAVLAEGVRGAARLIGSGAEKYAIETKGLEFAAVDPRFLNYVALSCATSNRGACHMETNDPQLAKDVLQDQRNFPFAVEGMAEKVVRGQNFGGILNSLAMCFFCTSGTAISSAPESYTGLSMDEVTQWFNLVTGMDWDYASLMRAGDKIYNLKHLINIKCGYDSTSDTLPERFTTLKRQPGPHPDHLPPIKQLVADYYKVRGWKKDGTIKAGKLKELGLEAL
jgi:aldehyde:ferredoxin oxidoreductase